MTTMMKFEAQASFRTVLRKMLNSIDQEEASHAVYYLYNLLDPPNQDRVLSRLLLAKGGPEPLGSEVADSGQPG